MEYKSWYYSILGLILIFIWSLSFWKFFQKGLIFKASKKSDVLLIGKGFIYLLGLVGLSYITYSLSFPREPLSYSNNTKNVKDIFLVVDVSRSMLAQDLKPDRLEVAKEKLAEFAKMRPNDRIGIILFSEKVFTLLPLTTDSSIITKFMGDISVGRLGSGTNIGDALALAVARSQASETKKKVIILLTDGVSNVGNLTPMEAAEQAKNYGIKVYTIGLGSDRDASLPGFGGLPGFQRIPGGSIDLKTLKKISDLTGAKSFRARDKSALKQILNEIEKLERTKIKIKNQRLYKELYHEYLLIGFILFFLAELLKRFVLREAY